MLFSLGRQFYRSTLYMQEEKKLQGINNSIKCKLFFKIQNKND